MQRITKPRADKIRSLKALHQGQTDDLVLQHPFQKIWVSRVELDRHSLPLVSIESRFQEGWTVTAIS